MILRWQMEKSPQCCSIDKGCAGPLAWSHDLILPQPMSPKCIPQRPERLTNREAGGHCQGERLLCCEVPFGQEHLPNWPHGAEDMAMVIQREANNDIQNFSTRLILRESCFQMRPFISFLLRDLKAPKPCSVPYGSSNTNSI